MNKQEILSLLNAELSPTKTYSMTPIGHHLPTGYKIEAIKCE